MIGELGSRLGPVYRSRLPAVLLVAVALNLLLTPLLPEHAQPVKWHGEPDLGILVFEERESVAIRFGIYEHIREVAGGGLLIIPIDGVVDPHIARGLGDVRVESREYDATVDASGWEVIATGTYDGSGEVLQYVIVQGVGDTWWVGRDGDLVVVVPATGLPVPEASNG